MRKRFIVGAALLVAVLLFLSGCAPRAGTPLAESMDASELYVDLPAIVIDFDTAGQASVGGVPAAQLGALAGVDPASLSLPPEWISYFTLAGIQHIQIVNNPEGLIILVNSQPVPSLTWDEGSLVATAETVKNLGVALPVLERVLPLVQQLGLGITLRFPVEEGTEAIALGQMSESEAAAQAQQAQQEFLAAVGDTPPRINVPIVYDEAGNFSVGNLSTEEVAELVGPAVSALQLPASLIQSLANAGITTMSLATDPEGIHLSVNDQALPTISWGRGEVQNILQLPGVRSLLESSLGADAGSVLETVQNLLPVIQTANANITIFLPGSQMGN